MAHETEKRSQGRRGYHFRHRKGSVPRLRETPATPFDALAKAAYPGPYIAAPLKDLLGDRASPNTIKAWRYGLRPAPAWARDLLQAKCLESLRKLEAAIFWDNAEREKKKASESAGP